MRLIDADKLKEDLSWVEGCAYIEGVDQDILQAIDSAPTVAEDYDTGYQDGLEDGLNDIRPQGKWIWEYRTCKCSVCNFATVIDTYNFCPNCGARCVR